MIHFIASILMILSLTVTIPTPVVAASRLSTVGQGPTACVKGSSFQNFRSSQNTIRFTNFCPDRVYINVCVTYNDGTNKLYPSGRRVQTGGNMQVYTDPFKTPVAVNMAYSPDDAAVPPPCSTGVS